MALSVLCGIIIMKGKKGVITMPKKKYWATLTLLVIFAIILIIFSPCTRFFQVLLFIIYAPYYIAFVVLCFHTFYWLLLHEAPLEEKWPHTKKILFAWGSLFYVTFLGYFLYFLADRLGLIKVI